MARRPVSRQGLQAISMVIQPSTTAAMAITAVTTAPILSSPSWPAICLLVLSQDADLEVAWSVYGGSQTGSGMGIQVAS